MESIRKTIIDCLENIGIFLDDEDGDENICDYGMSSLDYILLICDIEESLSIEMPDDYLNIQKVVSINKLANIALQAFENKDVLQYSN